MKCPYCKTASGRCATTASGRSVTECTSCGRVVEERQTQPHHLFHLRAVDSPLCLVTPDLPSAASPPPSHCRQQTLEPPETDEDEDGDEEDPFEATGFINTFSTWSLEHNPVFARSSVAFSGHLAELERVLESLPPSGSAGPAVVMDNLRAYLQIIDVASILGLEYEISDHAFQLFRDCSSATCLRNRSVEALATAALVQAIREAQEPRTLQEISIAANVPQKEIGKYIKILGEALQLSQPLNSNSISVHMPRFCTLLQLNKSAQELATHIGEVVINKCFCTRRNPISISAAAIYLACQLEDKRKTQAEICKVTGLTEVTLRKVYKELLENWDDLLPSNYTPAVPPEKAFPTTTIPSGRPPSSKVDLVEVAALLDRNRWPETKPIESSEVSQQTGANDNSESKGNSSRSPVIRQPPVPFGTSSTITGGGDQKKNERQEIDMNTSLDTKAATTSVRPNQFTSAPGLGGSPITWPFQPSSSSGVPSSTQFVQPSKVASSVQERKGVGSQLGERN